MVPLLPVLGRGNRVSCSVPRVRVRVVTGMTGGEKHSLLTTATGSVLSFGSNTDVNWRTLGHLGLGAEVKAELAPRVIPGITAGGGGEGEPMRTVRGRSSYESFRGERQAQLRGEGTAMNHGY